MRIYYALKKVEERSIIGLIMREQDHYREEGYSGLPFNQIPQGLRQRVEAAVETSRQTGTAFEVNLVLEEDGNWQYGRYTDVFALDNNHLLRSFHRVGDKIYKIFFTGGGDARILDELATSLGFDREKAEIIPGFGWEGRRNVSFFEMELTPTGPYYGQVIPQEQ